MRILYFALKPVLSSKRQSALSSKKQVGLRTPKKPRIFRGTPKQGVPQQRDDGYLMIVEVICE